MPATVLSVTEEHPSADNGWEIANAGDTGSPAEPSPAAANANANAVKKVEEKLLRPDVVLSKERITQYSAKDDALLCCSICCNTFKFVKPLGCRCKACMNCADRMLMQSQDCGSGQAQQQRCCPICGQEPAVQANMFRAQKPEFGNGALKCMACRGGKDVQDGWWCQDCSMILCSKCAHKSHRDHATVEFDQDYEAVRFCLSMLQLDTHDTAARMKTMAWGKLEEIFKTIGNAIDDEFERQNKIRRTHLTDVFGNCQRSQQSDDDKSTPATGNESVYKRFSLTQTRAKAQFPSVLSDVLSMSGLDSSGGGEGGMDLKTDVAAERVIDILRSAANQLSLDSFKIEGKKYPAGDIAGPPYDSMQTRDCQENVTYTIRSGDSCSRHY